MNHLENTVGFFGCLGGGMKVLIVINLKPEVNLSPFVFL